MESFLSRSEGRQIRFEFRASKGIFSSEETLYLREARKLSSNGFSVVKVSESEIKRGLGLYQVSWEKPYGTEVPPSVEEYLNGKGDYPFADVKTTAQSLYVLSRLSKK